MLYTLLGKLVWRIAKLVLRRKLGSSSLPRPVVAGGLAAAVVGVAVVLGRRAVAG